MKRINLFTLILICVCLAGCVGGGGGSNSTSTFCRSYIFCYVNIGELPMEYKPDQAQLVAYVKPSRELRQDSQLPADKEKFAYLANKHNDTSWNQWVDMPFLVTDVAVALIHDYTSIQITSDADFDEEHPAGASLGDIIEFQGYTYKPLLDRQYLYSTGIDLYDATEVKKVLNTLTCEDLAVLTKFESGVPDFRFNFLSLPTASKVHNFKIKFTTDTGSEYVYYTTVDFGVQNEE